MGALELCRLLDRRLVQHQHLDDLVVHDRRRPVVVAVVAMRLDRLCHLRLLHLLNRPHRRHLPYRVPRCQPLVVRYLGEFVAGF